MRKESILQIIQLFDNRSPFRRNLIRLLAIKLFMYGYMFPMLVLFRFFAGSHQYKRKHMIPTEKDVCGFARNPEKV